MKIYIYALFLALFSSVTASAAIQIDKSETSNLLCPGEKITFLDDLKAPIDITALASVDAGWDSDKFYFKIGANGTLKMILTADKPLTFKAGNQCNTQTYFRSENKKLHEETIQVSKDDNIFLSTFDWESGTGYPYNIRFVFVPDHPVSPTTDTTPPVITLKGANPVNINAGDPFTDPGATATDDTDGDITAAIVVTGTVDTSKAGTYSLTYSVSDQAGNAAEVTRTVIVKDTTPPPSASSYTESHNDTNGLCPAELLTPLDNIQQTKTLQVKGIMQAGWDIDRYRFTPAAAGTVEIKLTAPQAMTIKGGNACNTQTYFRSNDALSHDVTFHVGANELVSLSMFDWDTDNYDYDLTISFTPDNAPPPGGDDNQTIIYGLDQRPENHGCYFPYKPGENSSSIENLVLNTVTAFPGRSFSNPVGLYQQPGNNDRWYVLELPGRIKTFLTNGTTSTALDITDKTIMQAEQGLLGMAFHPEFPTKPYLYLSYTDLNGNSVISRFTSHDNGISFDKNSEKIILQVDQPYDNHNGGNIAFGPDGYLYIGFGDGGNGNDPHNNGQNTATLLASMLRIDVNHGDPYAIPSDNPFASNPKAVNGNCSGPCPEIFAWGLRNPWRWSFDKLTGKLWVGDVGQNAWEEVDIVEKGKNYGWRCKEGFHTTANSCNNISNIPFTDPVLEYPNTGYNAVTGGYVYRGNAIPALRGVYLFSDYVTGTIKGYLPNGTIKELVQHGPYIASFAQDNNGELYALDVWAGTIKKIVATSGANSGTTFPQKLSETGCFNGTEPSTALIPYNVNVLLWSDNLQKKRWLTLQDGTTIQMDEEKRQWIFPIGTVLIKEFDKEDGTKIETRFLTRHNDGSWGAYSYKWNEAGTDATLVDTASSINEDIGGQVWTFPSSAQCFGCHTPAAHYVLGPETVQMNMNEFYPSTGRTANQIDTYNHIGMFNPPLQTLADTLDKFEDNASIAKQARAYLHSNCSGCHMPGGGTPSSMDLRYFKPLKETNTCNKVPNSGDFGIANAKIINPGDAEHSILTYRVGTRTDAKMPPYGSHIIDQKGLQLLKDWINSLNDCE